MTGANQGKERKVSDSKKEGRTEATNSTSLSFSTVHDFIK